MANRNSSARDNDLVNNDDNNNTQAIDPNLTNTNDPNNTTAPGQLIFTRRKSTRIAGLHLQPAISPRPTAPVPIPDWQLPPRQVSLLYPRPGRVDKSSSIHSRGNSRTRPAAGKASSSALDQQEQQQTQQSSQDAQAQLLNLRSRALPRSERETTLRGLRKRAYRQPASATAESNLPFGQQAQESNEESQAELPTERDSIGLRLRTIPRPERVVPPPSLRARSNRQPPSAAAENNLTTHEQAEKSAQEPSTEASTNTEPASTIPAANTRFYCNDPTSPFRDSNAGHTLCLTTHPCIWTIPLRAREVYAQRAHWLRQGWPLEVTERANGHFPALINEFGESMTKAVDLLERNQDPNDAYDELVRERFAAVIRPGELGVGDGQAEWVAHRAALARVLEDGDSWAE